MESAFYKELDSTWAPTFYSDGWRPRLSDPNWKSILGFTSTLTPDPDKVYRADIFDLTGRFLDQVQTNGQRSRLESASHTGGWFYYGSVSAPATLSLFGLALAGLGWTRRKKA